MEPKEAGQHRASVRKIIRTWLATCPDCAWRHSYQSEREARFFADVHHRRLGQIPGQLVLG